MLRFYISILILVGISLFALLNAVWSISIVSLLLLIGTILHYIYQKDHINIKFVLFAAILYSVIAGSIIFAILNKKAVISYKDSVSDKDILDTLKAIE